MPHSLPDIRLADAVDPPVRELLATEDTLDWDEDDQVVAIAGPLPPEQQAAPPISEDGPS